MWRFLKRTGIALILAFLLGIAWLATKTAAYDSDRREAEWKSLTRMVHAISAKQIPESWVAGVFVSTRSMNALLAGLKDATVSFDPTYKSEDTTLTLRRFNLDFSSSFPVGEIELLAASKSRNLQLELVGEAALTFEGYQFKPGEKPVANFRIDLIRVEPQLRWQFFNLGIRGYAADLLTTGIAVALSKGLKVNLPLPDMDTADLSQKRNDKVPVRDPKDENWVQLATTIPLGKLRTETSFGYPIFALGGIWIGAEGNFGGQRSLESVERGNRTDSELDQEITQLRKQLAAFKAPFSPDADLALWLNGKSVTKLLQTIADLALDRRTATIVSTSYAGYLAKKDWSDKILGNGGAFVELNKPDAVRAKASLNSFSADWKAGKGLTFAGHLSAEAGVDIHVHVDPLLGGGVGTNVGMQGSAETDIAGEINFRVVRVADHSLLGFFPKVGCNTFGIDLTTDGKLVGDWGWTKVPKIGGRFSAPVDSGMIAPQVILTDYPTVLKGRDDDGGGLKFGDGAYRFMPVWKMAKISFVPLKAEAGDMGILTTAALKIELAPEWADISKANHEAESKLREAFKAANKPDSCAGETSFAVLLGDIEIGPNNEIIKFLRNAWNDITKGPGKNNEVVKVLRAATDAVAAAGQPVDDATKRALNDINGLAKNSFGENSEAAKAVTVIASTLAPPTVGRNADGGVTVTVPGGGTVSTGGGHGGAGVTVSTPVGSIKF